MSDLFGQFVGVMGADGGVEQHCNMVLDKLKAWQYSREELDTTIHSFEVGDKGAVSLCGSIVSSMYTLLE